MDNRKSARGWPGRKRDNHPCWKGGWRIDRDGYVRVYRPEHKWPRKGGYILEHVYVIEMKIGRRILPGECVHHKDHNRKNNALENLELIERGEHSKKHRAKDKHKIKRDSNGRFECGFF